MDFLLTEYQMAKKKEFDDFFITEQNRMNEKYLNGEAQAGLFSDTGWEHFQHMKKTTTENRLLDNDLAQGIWDQGLH